MKNYLLILFFIFFTLNLSAQVKKWTLQECVEYALENNISVKNSELDLEMTDIEKKDAIGRYLPAVNASASNSWNTGLTQDVTTGVLRNQTTRNSSYNIGVGINVFKGLNNYRQIQRAKLSKLAFQYQLDKMVDDIALLVANNYLQVLLNKANLEVIQSQNAVTQDQIKRTYDLVEAGVLPRGDLLEIKANDANEKQRISIAENTLKISLLSLAQLLLIKDYENFDIADDDYQIIDNGFSKKSVTEILESAIQNRPDVKIAEKNLEIAEKDLQIAKSAYHPTISAFFNYNTRESNSKRNVLSIDPDNPTITTQIGVVESSGEPVVATIDNTFIEELNPLPYMDQLYINDGISYGFQLSVPVFNGFTTRNNVKRNIINKKRYELLLEQASLDLESNIYQAFVDVKGALKSYESAISALESQELAYQYAKDRYDVGLTNAFDFSQSKLRFDSAQIEVNRSKYEYIFKLKVLELYFGIPATELKF
jgi:outer membrane protein